MVLSGVSPPEGSIVMVLLTVQKVWSQKVWCYPEPEDVVLSGAFTEKLQLVALRLDGWG